MRCYEMYEMEFNGNAPEGSEVDVSVEAEFVIGEKRISVKGFYDGGGSYKVRFLPQETGCYQWKITGAIQAEGEVHCESALNSHGIVRVEGTHFVYQDGTKYLPFGTTVYALVHQPEVIISQTLKTLKKSPFNKVRHCMFPKHYDYNHNDPEYYPFEKNENGNWDVHRPCFAYWHHLEAILEQLGAMGIESDLIMFHPYDRWGFSELSVADSKTYLDYMIRRLSSFPNIWWSMANEYDLLFNYTEKDWYDFEKFIVKNDPYGHLLSNHNGLTYYDFGRANITHCCFQTGELFKAGLWQRKYKKPVLFDEICYEGDLGFGWGSISGFEMTNRFWKVCSSGAYATHGETYCSEDDVLWWSKGGIIKGTSPTRIEFLKKVLYSLPDCLEPWEEGFSVTDETKDENTNTLLQIPFFKAFYNLPLEERKDFEWPNGAYTGRCKEDAFLKYFAGQCARKAEILLPEDKEYKIEILDVWNMTRDILITHASGNTPLELPGREGMAVLATRIG